MTQAMEEQSTLGLGISQRAVGVQLFEPTVATAEADMAGPEGELDAQRRSRKGAKAAFRKFGTLLVFAPAIAGVLLSLLPFNIKFAVAVLVVLFPLTAIGIALSFGRGAE